MSASCKAQIKEYCQNCSFAGIRFIADDSKHWIERWFWVVLVILSWYGSALLIIAAWNAFVNNPISFGVETTYTDWSTKMPAVAVCEMANDDQIYNVSDTIWTPKHLLDLEDVLKDIAYFRGVAYSLIDVCYLSKNPDHLCPLSNYSYYTELVRSPCPKLIRNCSYNNIVFECCDYFQPIKTDLGTCYIINSIQTENPRPYPMISNITQKRGILRFQIMLLSMIYTIGEDEIPGITTLYSSTLKASLGNTYLRQVSVRDIENDPLVVETTPEQRACRFNSENQGLYPHYSYSACIVLCRKRAQLDICHCNDHFMLNTSDSERCNITGMWCLHTHSKQLTALKPPWSQRQGLVCDCLPSCEETDITIIKDVTTPLHPKRKKAFVEVMLPYLPTERFKRNVVRSRLDLVVSVGSTAGLFVGASLLSFVELIFFFTVRYISNVLMEKRKRKRVRIILPRH
ncbi:sodium channel protein Nach [Aricia agestis]|uniref:sodium channel protein Nach n=1 Tax=Aricia agestis TaxID=91739 RepID=UPI001C20A028|nr:sodium channel protein Nach [Aricia agestis]